MMGKNNYLMTGATLHTSLHKLSNRRSETVSKAIEQADYHMHTVTFDNDLGFANHREVAEALNVDTYFTRPYTSQDKGTVENRIGQIRRFFPKKTDLSMVTVNQVKRVEQLLNDRPVRKFNYLTPNQATTKDCTYYLNLDFIYI
jgi:IS30 family transposase